VIVSCGFIADIVYAKTMAGVGRVSVSDSDQYNRIFIIGARDCSSSDIREAFEQFGEITDVYLPRGKSPYDTKGELSH